MRYLAALFVLLAYALLCLECWRRCRQRQLSPIENNDASILIAYASQTGTAEHIAHQTLTQLRAAQQTAAVLPLNKVDATVLSNFDTVLFVVSTYGEGEPPDNAASFLPRLTRLQEQPDLSQIRYAVLALGDRSYQHFCAFGYAVDHALHQAGAIRLFDLTEVDGDDQAALRHWQYYLGQLSGQSDFSDWSRPEYEQWRLAARRYLNRGSPGNPVFHVQCTPIGGSINSGAWQAGDIAEIGPCNSGTHVQVLIEALSMQGSAVTDQQREQLRRRRLPRAIPDRVSDVNQWIEQLPTLPHREYSIASVPADGSLDLVVRQAHNLDGELGLGSGWLTEYAQLGEFIQLRIRTNKNFHAPDAQRPMILIGNGTGLAGLRAHIRARPMGTKNWLLFGERTLEHDFYFADELLAWKASGHLAELDLTFSRDQQPARYVQHALLDKQNQVKQWLEQGAAVYVCGSLQGMAQDVDTTLTQIMGADYCEQLVDEGRYRRDVY